MRAADPALLAQGPGHLHQEESGGHRAQPRPVLGRADAGASARGLRVLQIMRTQNLINHMH